MRNHTKIYKNVFETDTNLLSFVNNNQLEIIVAGVAKILYKMVVSLFMLPKSLYTKVIILGQTFLLGR